MAEKSKKGEFPRDEEGKLVCSTLPGQDKKACQELSKKEMIDEFPRNDKGLLECSNLSGDDRVLCQRQKASEAVRKSVGLKTEGDTD